jgi:hypothetical protein
MRKTMGCSIVLCLLLALSGGVVAQEQANMGPPKVLVITREFVKPGKSGPTHNKSESAFVHAMAAAKWPQHYFAMDSLTGPPRSLFMDGFDSFEAWEKDNRAMEKNATLSAALSKAAAADGELLASLETSVFVYREDLSFQAPPEISKMRYFDITLFKVRPGHEEEWDTAAKMYKDGFSKAVPDSHWAMFQAVYGMNSGGVYIVISPLKSLAEVDKSFGDWKKFSDTVGGDGMKKLGELMSSAVETAGSNLFAFNPEESYTPPEWVKSDPEFWKTKSPLAGTPAKKEEPKPKQ